MGDRAHITRLLLPGFIRHFVVPVPQYLGLDRAWRFAGRWRFFEEEDNLDQLNLALGTPAAVQVIPAGSQPIGKTAELLGILVPAEVRKVFAPAVIGEVCAGQLRLGPRKFPLRFPEIHLAAVDQNAAQDEPAIVPRRARGKHRPFLLQPQDGDHLVRPTRSVASGSCGQNRQVVHVQHSAQQDCDADAGDIARDEPTRLRTTEEPRRNTIPHGPCPTDHRGPHC